MGMTEAEKRTQRKYYLSHIKQRRALNHTPQAKAAKKAYRNSPRGRLFQSIAGKRNTLKRLALIQKFKERPCADCGGVFPPYVMDFDHVRGEKAFTISRFIKLSLPKVLAEIEKCDVVCSNCHRMRTFRNRGLGHEPAQQLLL